MPSSCHAGVYSRRLYIISPVKLLLLVGLYLGAISTASAQSDDAEAVGKAFVSDYYNAYDANRAQLGGFYQQDGILTFESESFQGADKIQQKLTSLPFQQSQHRVFSLDAQPSPSGGVIVFVTGQLSTEGVSNFSQVFYLAPVGSSGSTSGSSFAISNDMFQET